MARTDVFDVEEELASVWSTFATDPDLIDDGPPEEEEEEEPLSIDALLDEEGIVYKIWDADNHSLLAALSTADALLHLVRYIVANYPDDYSCSSLQQSQRPFIVGELLTNHREHFCPIFFLPESAEAMHTFWSFLDTSSDHPMAHYLSTLAASLFTMRPVELAAYLRQRDSQHLLHSFLVKLEFRSYAELFVLLLCAEKPTHVVFTVDGLVRQLVAVLESDGRPTAAYEHVSLIFDTLLAHACVGALCCSGEFLRQLDEPGVVAALIERALCGRSTARAAASASLAVLASSVSHFHLLSGDPLLPERGTELRAPPRADSGVGEPAGSPASGMASVTVAAADDAAVSNAAAAEKAASDLPPPPPPPPSEPSEGPAPPAPEEPPPELPLGKEGAAPTADALGVPDTDAAGETAVARLEKAGASVVNAICAHLSGISGLLHSSRGERTDSRGFPVAGSVSVEAVCLVAMLVKTGRAIVFETLLSAQVLQSCVEAMLAFAWNGLLHNAVRSLFLEVSGNQEQGLQIILSFLADGPLVDRLVAEHRAEEEARSAGLPRRRAPQVGYMGHLRSMSAELCDLGRVEPEVAAALDRIGGWNDFVVPDVEAAARLQAEALGGLSPPGPTPDPSSGWQAAIAGLTDSVFAGSPLWPGCLSDQVDVVDDDICRGANEDVDDDQLGLGPRPECRASGRRYCAEDTDLRPIIQGNECSYRLGDYTGEGDGDFQDSQFLIVEGI